MSKREEDGGVRKLYLFFHSVEIAILLWLGFVFTNHIYMLSVALGYTGHMFLDVTGNILKPGAYFITARIKNDFRTARFVRNH